jgi:hypothetical protein
MLIKQVALKLHVAFTREPQPATFEAVASR